MSRYNGWSEKDLRLELRELNEQLDMLDPFDEYDMVDIKWIQDEICKIDYKIEELGL